MKLIPPWLQTQFDRLVTPVADLLIAARIHPNTLTTFGFFLLLAAGGAFGAGHARLGGFLLLVSGCLDMLDGKVARGAGMMSQFGAFYDSTVDRMGESALFVGIAVFFMLGGVRPEFVAWAVAITIVGLSAGLLVSYTRARAEGLQLECKVGIAQRAERILGLGLPTLFFGAGREGFLLFGVVFVLTLLSVVTVVQRIYHVYKVARTVPRDAADRSAAARSGSFRSGRP